MLVAILSLFVVQGCHEKPKPAETTVRALVFYESGFNSLSEYLRDDIKEIKEGELPTDADGQNLVFIVERLTAEYQEY